MTKKLNLNQLKVQSFVTQAAKKEVRGGYHSIIGVPECWNEEGSWTCNTLETIQGNTCITENTFCFGTCQNSATPAQCEYSMQNPQLCN